MADLKPKFKLKHATDARVIKGEDAVFASALHDSLPECMIFMVCDGHMGVKCADFVVDNFLGLLRPKLPRKLPNENNPAEISVFAKLLSKALADTFVDTDNKWLEVGHLSGTTVTILVVTGSLLTVANIGDSEAVLDTGLSILEMTKSHRLQVNLQEQARLKKANYQLAPYGFHLQGPSKPGEQGVGPIRVWPGGLCVSRSVGDGDVGPEVVPLPHIRQVLVPSHGCRLILGSDGLWDIFRFSKAVQITRKRDTSEAAWELMEVAGRNYRVIDDTSVIIVDVIPADKPSFPASVAALPVSAAPPAQGGFFACCGPPEVPEPCSLDEQGPGFLAYYNDFDTITAYPTCKAELARNSYTPVTESSARGVHKRITPLAPLGYVKPAGGDLGVSAEMRASLNGGGLKAIASVSEVGVVLDHYRDASARPAIHTGAGPLLEATSNYSRYAQSDSPSNCGQPLKTLPGVACHEDYGAAGSPRSPGRAAADHDPSGRSGMHGQRGGGLYTVSRGQPSEGQDPSMHGGSAGGRSQHGPISRTGTDSHSNFKRPDTSMTNLEVDVNDLSDEEHA